MYSNTNTNTLKAYRPTTIDHLHLAEHVQILGYGGSGVVSTVRCKQEHTCNATCNQLFVMKQIKQQTISKEKLARILQKEFELHMRLNMHPNILNILDVDTENMVLVYEYFTGIDMLDLLNAGRGQLGRRLTKYIIQIFDAVQYMHAHGVAHCDIKLENVVVNTVTHVSKLIDFGHICEIQQPNTWIPIKHITGTEEYLPPEFMKTNVPVGCILEKVDAWCAGVMLYNAMFDEMPWATDISIEGDIHSKHAFCFQPSERIVKVASDYNFSDTDSAIIHTVLTGLLETDAATRMDVGTAYKQLLLLNFQEC